MVFRGSDLHFAVDHGRNLEEVLFLLEGLHAHLVEQNWRVQRIVCDQKKFEVVHENHLTLCRHTMDLLQLELGIFCYAQFPALLSEIFVGRSVLVGDDVGVSFLAEKVLLIDLLHLFLLVLDVLPGIFLIELHVVVDGI